MEELIVLLIVSLQLFLFTVCQFWLGANSAMCVVQDGLFTEGRPEWKRICFWRGDRQAAMSQLTVPTNSILQR